MKRPYAMLSVLLIPLAGCAILPVAIAVSTDASAVASASSAAINLWDIVKGEAQVAETAAPAIKASVSADVASADETAAALAQAPSAATAAALTSQADAVLAKAAPAIKAIPSTGVSP